MRSFYAITRRIRVCAGRFRESTNGNVAMIFGLVIVLLVMVCGAGIDVARAVSMRARLASALDAAALAVGSELNKTDDQLELLAQNYFDANYPAGALGTPQPVSVVPAGDSSYALSVTGSVETVFLRLVDIDEFDVSVSNQVTRSANNIEVAMALDITGSMKGQQLTDLKIAAKDMVDMIVQDVQTPYYTKLAIVPYAAAVNVGSYANSVRGPTVAAKTITGAAWQTGGSTNISGATKANPAVITTQTAHGLVAGNKIWISGVTGMTQLNNKPYIVGTVPSSTTFQLKNYNNVNINSTSGYSTYTTSATDIVRRCAVPTVGVNGCEIQVTSAGHGFANGVRVVIKNVVGAGGMTAAINNDTTDNDDGDDGDGERATWPVSSVTANTFVVPAVVMPSGENPTWTYTSGGSAYCTTQGCEYLRVASDGGEVKVFQISTCVSERTANAFTDVAPTTTLLGRNYPASPQPPADQLNPCVGQTITPLSTNKATLKAQIDTFVAAGSTAGHLGVAWGWYMISPNFGYLWPAASQPAAYGTDHLFKVLVLMTDGAFNTSYCNDVVSQLSTSGSGSSNDHSNCNSPNGGSFTQAQALCNAMKAPGSDVIIYTVGFNIGSDANAQAIMAACATDSDHDYYPATGAELKTTFQLIAQEISELRLSQ